MLLSFCAAVTECHRLIHAQLKYNSHGWKVQDQGADIEWGPSGVLSKDRWWKLGNRKECICEMGCGKEGRELGEMVRVWTGLTLLEKSICTIMKLTYENGINSLMRL